MPALMNIPFVHHQLANGLDVIVHEDHDCPIVAVNVWYHVGSKNEEPGRTGFAHLFEHLMFEGSQHHDGGYFQPLQEAGGVLNGSTNADRTNYWEVVPTNAAGSGALDGIRSHGLPAAGADRRQVREPARRGAERAAAELREPPVRVRRHGARGGALSAGSSVPLADDRRRRGHARRAPRRRARVLSDLLPAAQRVARARGRHRRRRARSRSPTGTSATSTPARSLLRSRPAAPRCVGETRLVLEDRVELPRLYLAWHSPALFAEDDAELDLVSEVLAGGKTSRLYRSLVYEQRIATEVAASQNSRELGSFFQIVATAAPGRTLAEVEAAIARELARLAGRRADGGRARTLPGAGGGALPASAADGRRFRRQVGSVERLQRLPRRPRVLRRGSGALSPGGRRRAAASARRAGCGEGRVALSVVPHGRAALALERLAAGGGILMPVDRSRLPALGSGARVRVPGDSPPPAGERPRVWTVEHREVPLLSVLVLVRAGASFDPGRPSRARRHHRRPARRRVRRPRCARVHEALGRLGAQLDTEVGSDATLVGLTTLERSAAPSLALLADMITRPRLRRRRLRSRPRSAPQPAAAAARHAAGGRRARVHRALVRRAPVRPPADRDRSRRCAR